MPSTPIFGQRDFFFVFLSSICLRYLIYLEVTVPTLLVDKQIEPLFLVFIGVYFFMSPFGLILLHGWLSIDCIIYLFIYFFNNGWRINMLSQPYVPIASANFLTFRRQRSCRLVLSSYSFIETKLYSLNL